MKEALMMPVLQALDACPGSVRLFLRDDDAGWSDDRLLALLDCLERAALPIDLAVIPQAIAAPLAHELAARHDAAPERLGVHQHGYVHANHEPDGARCEFGPARGPEAQHADIAHGRAVLIDRFEHRLDAIFTPPWNRCAAWTPAVLRRLGFAALSRDRGAPAQGELAELPVDLDWCKVRRRSGYAPEALVDALAAVIRRRGAVGEPIGLMLHHAAMDDVDLELLARILGEIALHPHACFRSMRSLLLGPAVASVRARARMLA